MPISVSLQPVVDVLTATDVKCIQELKKHGIHYDSTLVIGSWKK